MGHRLSKIYTRTGDTGTTALGDGTRTPKDSTRVEALGAVDELNAAIAVLLAERDLPSGIRAELTKIQHELFDLGGELCLPGHSGIRPEQVSRLEQILDELNADLPPLKEFILPGGNRPAALCHMARSVCRRAERRVVTLSHAETVQPTALTYLNRLSDLLFVIARVLARQAGGEEVLWDHSR